MTAHTYDTRKAEAGGSELWDSLGYRIKSKQLSSVWSSLRSSVSEFLFNHMYLK